MATFGLQVGIYFVIGRDEKGWPELSPHDSRALTFLSFEAAEEFGRTLVYPAGTIISREVWNSLQVVTGRCVIFKGGKYLSATSDEVAWVSDVRHARQFTSREEARTYVQRRMQAADRHIDDALELLDSQVRVIFTTE